MSYIFEVDWDKDGTFTTEPAGKVLAALIRRGKASAFRGDAPAPTETGTAVLTVSNRDGRYDLFNSSSAVYDYLIPNRPMRLSMDDEDGVSSYTFTGFIRNIIPQNLEGIARIECVDASDYLTRKKSPFSTSVETDILVSDAIGTILTETGYDYSTAWTFPVTLGTDSQLGGANIDDNGDTIPYWWMDPTTKVWDALSDLALAFAGEVYIDRNGDFRYRARNYVDASLMTLTDDDVSRDTETLQPLEFIKNDITITIAPRVLTDAGIDIWTLGDIPGILAGESITIWAEYQYETERAPAAAVTTPVATTDYTANAAEDGGGADKTADIAVVMTAYATKAKLVITNNDAAKVYVTLCKLRGQLYRATDRTDIVDSDSTSQGKYEEQSIAIGNDWCQEQYVATQHAEYLLDLFKDPRRNLIVKQRNPAHLSRQLRADLYDVITLDLARLGCSGRYRIIQIEHDFKPRNFLTTWRLEPTVDEIMTVWQFPVTLGTDSYIRW